MSPAAARKPPAGETDLDRGALQGALEALASHDARFTERFYEIFFERRPDTLVLFGTHSIAEREEMMAETFRSLVALQGGESWLEGNLTALGHSHAEYGVTPDMYRSFVEVWIECTREILGETIEEAGVAALRDAVAEVARQMSDAGQRATED